MLFHASVMAAKTGNFLRHNSKDLEGLLHHDFSTSPLLTYSQPATSGKISIPGYCGAARGTKNDPSGRYQLLYPDAVEMSYIPFTGARENYGV